MPLSHCHCPSIRFVNWIQNTRRWRRRWKIARDKMKSSLKFNILLSPLSLIGPTVNWILFFSFFHLHSSASGRAMMYALQSTHTRRDLTYSKWHLWISWRQRNQSQCMPNTPTEIEYWNRRRPLLSLSCSPSHTEGHYYYTFLDASSAVPSPLCVCALSEQIERLRFTVDSVPFPFADAEPFARSTLISHTANAFTTHTPNNISFRWTWTLNTASQPARPSASHSLNSNGIYIKHLLVTEYFRRNELNNNIVYSTLEYVCMCDVRRGWMSSCI